MPGVRRDAAFCAGNESNDRVTAPRAWDQPGESVSSAQHHAGLNGVEDGDGVRGG